MTAVRPRFEIELHGADHGALGRAGDPEQSRSRLDHGENAPPVGDRLTIIERWQEADRRAAVDAIFEDGHERRFLATGGLGPEQLDHDSPVCRAAFLP
jgi:hypothetical protein